MIRLLCLAIGYLFGLFQTSYILGRVHGIDIREYGSHNAGTTNMLRDVYKRQVQSWSASVMMQVRMVMVIT